MFEILADHGRNLLIGRFPSGPLGGLAMTLLLSLLCLSITFPAATAMALARTSGIRWLQQLCVGFLYAVRSMPLLMLVFWLYYCLPYLTGSPISPFMTMLIAITVFQTAYLSEVIRAAIEALPKGQVEAASALGMSYRSRTLFIVLPQALTNCIPGVVSQFILIIKETSLGYIITFNELTYVATELNNILLVKPVQIFAILALTYFILCSSLSRLSAWLERRIESRRKAIQHA